MLGLGAVILVTWFSRRRADRARRLLAAGLLCILIAGLQLSSAGVGMRWRVPLLNIVHARVPPEAGARAFFSDRGLPLDRLEGNLSQVSRKSFLRQVVADESPGGVQAWVDQRGRASYLAYLISSPQQTLLEPLAASSMLLSGDSSEYRSSVLSSPLWLTLLSDAMFPAGASIPLGLTGLGIFLLVRFAGRPTDRMEILPPVSLLLLVYPMMLVVWHGDAIEIERHALQLGVQLRLGAWWVLLLGVDALAVRLLRAGPAG